MMPKDKGKIMGKNVKKKKKFRLKKRARRTIASLLLVSALIVSLIPTRKETQAYVNPADPVMKLDDVIAAYQVVPSGNTSVEADNDDYFYAFPFAEGDEEEFRDTDGNTHHYYKINLNGMSDGTPVPVFEMGKIGNYNTLQNYIGYGTEYNNYEINLTAGVCYNENTPSSPTRTYYREEGSETIQYLEEFIDDDDVQGTRRRYYKISKQRGSTVSGNFVPNPDMGEETYYVCMDKCNVHYISDEAFKGSNEVNKIIIPTNDLMKIGNRAFMDCGNLSEAQFGSKVSSVGQECFRNCGKLYSINSASCSSLETIGNGAFAYCAFASMEMPFKSNLVIGSGAFYGCENLNDSLEGSNGMFKEYYNPAVASTTVKIGPYAFAECKSMTEMAMYKKLESAMQVGGGDFEGLFAGCSALRKVYLPESYGDLPYDSSTTVKLGQYMFQRCGSLERLKFYGRNAQPWDDYQFVTTSTLEYALRDKGYDSATVSDTFVIEGPIPYPTASHEAAAHVSAKKFSNTYNYKDGDKDIYELVLGNYIFNFNDGCINKIEPTEKAEDSLTIPTTIGSQAINTIGDNAYVSTSPYANNLQKLTIKDNITAIGKDAFKNADMLKRLYISTSGVTIGDSAFADEDELLYVSMKQVNGTSGATTIGNMCFYNSPKLLEIDFRDDTYNSDQIVDVNVKSIGVDAFKTNRSKAFDDGDLFAAGLKKLGGEDKGASARDLWLVMKGKVDDPSYVPYRFALNMSDAVNYMSVAEDAAEYDIFPEGAKDDGNRVSPISNSYITYASGNPENISAKYNGDEGEGLVKKDIGTKLFTYPTENTMVGLTNDGKGYYIKDIITRRQGGATLSATESKILQNLKYITIPEGIDYLDEAINTKDSTKGYMRGISGKLGDDGNYVNSITLNVTKLPDEEGIFKDDIYLTDIFFDKDVTDIGTLPFLFDYDEENYEWPNGIPDCSLQHVTFAAEGDKSNATPDNPYYWCDNGIIYSFDGTDTTLEEVLYGRGNKDHLSDIASKYINSKNDPELVNVSKIAESAFKNCPYLRSVDLSDSQKLKTIPENCFYNCPNLTTILLPESVNNIEKGAFTDLAPDYSVYIYGKEVYINPGAFDKTGNDPTIWGYNDSSARRFADDNDIRFEEVDGRCRVSFFDWDMTPLQSGDPPSYIQIVKMGGPVDPPPEPTREGYTFVEWRPDNDSTIKKVTTDPTVFVAYYKQNPGGSSSSSSSTSGGSSSSSSTSGSSSSSSSSTSKSSTKKEGGSSSTSTSTSTSSSSKSSSSSGANSSTMNSSTVPIVISGYASAPAANAAQGSIGTGSGGTGTGNTAGSGGKTNVISNAGGISDVGKMSAKVNGSSDNYVVKISETPEANNAAVTALTAEYGSLTDLRYLPIDISLYDSTGTNKISPVPEGVSVSITVPIPDDLAIYGGNAKVASTAQGTLEKMAPKFTVINSVPCMTFTATHFSPYVIYVDTANLTAEGTLDITPKTGDMIHPKWFLVVGLIAAALFMFLKRENEEVPVSA